MSTNQSMTARGRKIQKIAVAIVCVLLIVGWGAALFDWFAGGKPSPLIFSGLLFGGIGLAQMWGRAAQ